MEDLESGAYLVPAGDGTSEPLRIDLVAVFRQRQRLTEVAFVNQQKAPELLSAFNEAWLQLSRVVTELTSHKLQAEDIVRRRRAEAMLSYTDADVRARGFSKSSQDLRESLAELDPALAQARERLIRIRTVLGYLDDLRKAFENAFTSVKRIIQTNTLPTGTVSGPGTGPNDPFNPPAPAGFGTPRYR